MNITAIITGFVFGTILWYASLNRYNVISGMATLENLTVARALATAIGIGAFLIALENLAGIGTFHLKPFIAGGITAGGLIFGSGMAILGYCPGTLAVSLGEGSLDALAGIGGALAGGFVFTITLPFVSHITGPDFGSFSVYTLLGSSRFIYLIVSLLVGALLVWTAFRLKRSETGEGKRWLYSGIALAVLNAIVNLSIVANHPIGASTAYPYVADLITGTTGNSYFARISEPGAWELQLLAGSFLAGLVLSLARKDFRFTVIHSNWEKYRGHSVSSRIFWAFAGGFLLLFGARMAGGCTSGHILSGGMQLSASSIAFTIFAFAGMLGTGRFFYQKNKTADS